ncbi:MAG: hypothetical protein UFA98_06690 [Ruminococcus sp.]|nr:hypothetical protein [Ruminococcus sp.]
MQEVFQNGAVFLWAALAVLTFLIGRKQGAVGYLLTVFFIFMAVWYGLRAFAGLPVFDGIMSYVFRGILLVFLLVIILVWYRGRKKQAQTDSALKAHAENCDCRECRSKRF